VNGSSPGRGVLLCEECGQRTVVDGPLSAWRSASTLSKCRCGERSVGVDRPEGQRTGQAGSLTNPADKGLAPR
jgi:hypothetical protein